MAEVTRGVANENRIPEPLRDMFEVTELTTRLGERSALSELLGAQQWVVVRPILVDGG